MGSFIQWQLRVITRKNRGTLLYQSHQKQVSPCYWVVVHFLLLEWAATGEAVPIS
jgi:hypothetical protein